jgi:mono/diheme cytochrome c family protein
MTDEQIKKVLIYGRPFSPMPAWGLDGGGPLNEQQIDNLVLYLHQIAITPEEARQQNTEAAEEELARLQAEGGDQEASMGAALFNVNCARCHTQGWSYGEPEQPGGGFFGPSLSNVVEQFPAIEDHLEFVTDGTEIGDDYGVGGFSDGNMPYFGQVLSPEQIQAIIDYERGLADRPDEEAAPDQPQPPTEQPPTTEAPGPATEAPGPAPPGEPPPPEPAAGS